MKTTTLENNQMAEKYRPNGNFYSIENKILDGQSEIKADIPNLKTDLTNLQNGQKGQRANVSKLQNGQTNLREEMTNLKANQKLTEGQVGALNKRFDGFDEKFAGQSEKRGSRLKQL